MSAYVVDAETVDRIVTYVDAKVAPVWRSLRDDLYHIAKATTPQQLGQAFLAMNVRAVEQRYGQRKAVPVYRHTLRPATDMQVYKSLSCYLYQCSEGNIPDRPLYKTVERLQNHCASNIITDLPEYDRAAWG